MSNFNIDIHNNFLFFQISFTTIANFDINVDINVLIDYVGMSRYDKSIVEKCLYGGRFISV